MVRIDFLCPEDEKELKNLLDLNESIEGKLEIAINFFQNISSQYEIEDYIECLSSFFLEEFHELNSRLISIFFMEIFSLRALEYYGSEEDERNYVIMPALTLARLNEKGFDIDKIVGGFLQLDHEGDMNYQISQIIDYLLENNFIKIPDLVNILKNILMNDYASNVRVGRFLGILIEFKILKVNLVIDVIQTINSDLNLDIKQISEILIGTDKGISSSNIGILLFEKVLKLNNRDLKFLNDPTYISDQATGLTIIISNYLYENKSISHLLNMVLKIDATHVLAEAFKYLIDNSIINIKRLGFVLRNELLNGTLEFGILSSLISTNFSYFGISKLLASIIGKRPEVVSTKDFIEILGGFYDPQYHGFDNSDLKQILNNLHKINPEILYSLEIEDFDNFLGKLESFKKN